MQKLKQSYKIIVATGLNNEIGDGEDLVWNLPADMAFFKKMTQGADVIMGRKTFDSIGRPLPGRTNIVITRQTDYQAEGIVVVNSLQQALDKAADVCFIGGHDEAMVIGGAEIYQQALLKADRLYITHVHADVEGDAFFPEVRWNDWQEFKREDYQADEIKEENYNPFDYSFVVYDRIK